MKLTVIAATGGIGRQLLEQAVAAGHDVTAVVRNPSKLAATSVRVITADLAAPDPEALRPAVEGADAVLSGLGAVASAARPRPAGRDPGDGFVMRNLAYPVQRAAFREIYADLAEMEDVLRDSDLDWTVVRPVRLTGKPMTGRYRTAVGQNVRHGLSISRADVAHYMLRAIGDSGTFRQTVGIAN
jgi:putative NADH-flavin reductase